MDNTKESNSGQRVLSICYGYGGLDSGIKRIIPDLQPAAYVEVEAFCIQNMVAAMEAGILDKGPIWTNLKTFDGRPFRGKVDAIVGGYPCQPFSHAGQRKGQEDPRHLFPYILEHIQTIRPLWCFFENVEGHLNLGYDEVYKSLRDLGYTVEAGIFSALEVGATHVRKRLFILAVSDFSRLRQYSSFANGPNRFNQQKPKFGECSVTVEQISSSLVNPTSEHRGLSESDQWNENIETTRTGEAEMGNAKINTSGRLPSREGEALALSGKSSNSQQTSALANTRHDANCPKQEQQLEEYSKEHDGSHQLANSHSNRTGKSGGLDQAVEFDQNGENGESLDVGEAHFEGLERYQLSKTAQRWHIAKRFTSPSNFPAGPGEHQYEWEAPRVVGNQYCLPNTIRSMWNKSRKGFAKMLGEEIWQETDDRIKANFEPRVGGNPDGYKFRTDLLRMYGNGVVATCAAKAFQVLIDKMYENFN